MNNKKSSRSLILLSPKGFHDYLKYNIIIISLLIFVNKKSTPKGALTMRKRLEKSNKELTCSFSRQFLPFLHRSNEYHLLLWSKPNNRSYGQFL